jgi:hypothetical protein
MTGIPQMDSLKQKLSSQAPTPAEAAATDASIRANKRSVGARALANAVQAAKARGLSSEEIAKELAEQGRDYPALFAMLNGPGYSEAMLNAILTQLEAVEGGARSTHEASVAVGTVLVNSYVRPTLGMAPVPLPGSKSTPAHR